MYQRVQTHTAKVKPKLETDVHKQWSYYTRHLQRNCDCLPLRIKMSTLHDVTNRFVKDWGGGFKAKTGYLYVFWRYARPNLDKRAEMEMEKLE